MNGDYETLQEIIGVTKVNESWQRAMKGLINGKPLVEKEMRISKRTTDFESGRFFRLFARGFKDVSRFTLLSLIRLRAETRACPGTTRWFLRSAVNIKCIRAITRRGDSDLV